VTDPGQSFDRAAEEYERGRPGYPEGVMDVVPVAASATVLDLAAGTGKLTRVLARRYARVIAVEPLAALRAIVQREVPAAEALDGRAEAIPLADAAIDAVFVAQAFHWFANDDAVAEIARVLRPGGVLAILSNETIPPVPLPDAYRRRLDELGGERPRAAPKWRSTIARGPFEELRTESVEHEQVSDKDAVLAFAASLSFMASRDDREAALAELAELLPDGSYRFRMRADVTWTRRR
jgi:SAM-dependent methyltransferase